jgi:hypothetical protein
MLLELDPAFGGTGRHITSGGGVEPFALPTGMGTEVGGEITAAADMANADGR